MLSYVNQTPGEREAAATSGSLQGSSTAAATWQRARGTRGREAEQGAGRAPRRLPKAMTCLSLPITAAFVGSKKKPQPLSVPACRQCSQGRSSGRGGKAGS